MFFLTRSSRTKPDQTIILESNLTDTPGMAIPVKVAASTWTAENQTFLPEITKITVNLHQRWGMTSTSYMSLARDNRLFLEKSGNAYLAYRVHLGVAITVGDPVGEPQAVERCVFQFSLFCHQKRWLPIFFAIENHLTVYQTLGLRKIQVAEDAYLNLTALQFKGKAWQDVRTAINRGKREGLEFRRFNSGLDASQAGELAPGLNSPEVNRDQLRGKLPDWFLLPISEETRKAGENQARLVNQFREISEEWLKAKRIPELGFMLGGIATIHDPAVRTFYAIDWAGQVQGFVSWLPCPMREGWSLDLMRSRKDAMPGIIEFLIAHSALELKSQGYRTLGLGAAPLAPFQTERSFSDCEKILYGLKTWLDPWYGFSNLYNFKRKFQPDWTSLNMYYRPSLGIGLIRVFLALLLAYLRRPQTILGGNRGTSLGFR